MTKQDAATKDILARGVIEIIPGRELIEALRSGRKLRLKLGLDPSKPDLHIGHAVLLRKLRLLQELGHQVVLIVGDWTAQIGDPSGQSVQRPMLTADEVQANAETYMRQFFHVVDRERTEVRWQSEWFSAFTLADVVRLAARFTVAQMLQREDFRQRFESHQPLGIHELLYPLLQAYDSVAIQSDVEFGGSDQLFNMLVGRELQQEMGQRPQIVFTMRLLAGTDGSQKMSKSVGNTIDFEDPPNEKYGKVMSIPDSALMDYLELATDISDEELAYIRKQLEERAVNPMEIKKRLAREIVAQFHGDATAQVADEKWARVFQRKLTREGTFDARVTATVSRPFPFDKLPIVREVSSGSEAVVRIPALVASAWQVSMNEARRLLAQGAIEIDGETQRETNATLKVGSIIRVGSHRFLRIVDTDSQKTS